MKMFVRFAGIASAIFLSAVFFAAPASAQASRTWISGVGDDVNPCSRTAPCKTFAGAIAKTLAGGEIDCLDPGGFGAVTITKSITLDCGGGIGGQVGSILASATNGINVVAATTDVVKIRNLTINGLAKVTGSPGLAGIRLTTGAALIVEHVGIFGFGSGGASGTNAGVDFEPTSAAKLSMNDVEIQFCQADGVLIKPAAGITAMATLDHVSSLSNHGIGVRVQAGSNVTVSNSDISENAGGGLEVIASSGGKTGMAEVISSVLSQNSNWGVQSDGALATVVVGGSNVTGNSSGFSAISNSALKTFGDNYLFNGATGTSNGASTGSLSKL